MSTKRQSKVNNAAAAAQDAAAQDAAAAAQDAAAAAPVIVYDDNDYSVEALTAANDAAQDAGEQTIISTDENAHQVAWTIVLPDNTLFRAGLFAYIAGLNAKVRQANDEISQGIRTGKKRDLLNANPDVYTLVRLVTRLAVSRVKHAKITAESQHESAGFLIQTYAVNRSTGAFFRIPGKISQTYDSALFYRYASSMNGKQGLVYVLTRDNGVFYDAMDAQHGKGYTVSAHMAQTTRTALEKATRLSAGFTAWTPRAFNAWLADNVESSTGESEQAGF